MSNKYAPRMYGYLVFCFARPGCTSIKNMYLGRTCRGRQIDQIKHKNIRPIPRENIQNENKLNP